MRKFLFALLGFMTVVLGSCCGKSSDAGDCRVNVMDYIADIHSGNVAGDIQRAIDENPNRVIYFPDGVYVISEPIATPANPELSVSLELSNYTVIRAAEGWSSEEAMVRLGGKEPFNSCTAIGSNYYLTGGIIDCSGVATGVSIDSGRETRVFNTSIKNAMCGIHIKHGANSGSSDADVFNVNINGNDSVGCVGVLVEGFDNTFTNMRISNVTKGFEIHSGGNILTNLHPLFCFRNGSEAHYEQSIGFCDYSNNNFYNTCYSDQFATGFWNTGARNVYSNCFVFWYSDFGQKHIGFRSAKGFNSVVTNFTFGLNKDKAAKENYVLFEESGQGTGHGIFSNLHVEYPGCLSSDNYAKYEK